MEYIIIEADQGGLVGHLKALGKLRRKKIFDMELKEQAIFKQTRKENVF